MIRKLVARARAAAAAPVSLPEALVGVVFAGLGTWLVQRYIAQQQEQLIRAYAALRTNADASQRLAAELAAPYPAPEDLDPLARAAGDQDQADDHDCPICGQDTRTTQHLDYAGGHVGRHPFTVPVTAAASDEPAADHD